MGGPLALKAGCSDKSSMAFSPPAATAGPACWSLIAAGTQRARICNRSVGIALALTDIMGTIEISERQQKKAKIRFAFKLSYERGCQEKMLLGAVLGRGSGVHPAQCLFRRDFEFAECCERTGRPPVCTRRFHNEMVVDGHGSGSYASRRVGFSVPTMVLFETQGL